MQQKVTNKALYKLLNDQEHRCALTGRDLTIDTTALDHIIPRSDGGEHEMWNVQWVDSSVNTAKGTMGQDEFVRMCTDVATYKGACVRSARSVGVSTNIAVKDRCYRV